MGAYQSQWRELNTSLREIESNGGGLSAVFAALHAQQLEMGFIRDDLDGVHRIELCHPEMGTRCLRIQFNPERAVRFVGAGIQMPPPDSAVENDGCFLCPANIRWQQQGRQFGFELEVNKRPFIAWMNPFPLMPGHVVLASEDHQGQEWSLHPSGRLTPQQIIHDLVEIVARAPGYTGFYNGVKAGASIPGHLHYQLFRPPEDHRRYPLEIEAIAERNTSPANACWRLGTYPMESMHWFGLPADIAGPAADWIGAWAAHQDRLEDLSANIVAISEEQGGQVSLYFVPRDRNKNRANGLAGKVGGLEVLGELVFSTTEEEELLQSGQLDYFILEQVLSEVRTPLNMP
jgi:hypothetical protein